MVARGVGWGMGNLGEEDWEAQASRSGIRKSQGRMVQQREDGRWCCDSVVWGQMAATLAESMTSRIDLPDLCIVHLKLMYVVCQLEFT